MWKKYEVRKPPFGKCYSNCFRQDSSINARINEQKYDEKQNIYIITVSPLKVSPQKLITKRKIVT